jgi:hypothetical protein
VLPRGRREIDMDIMRGNTMIGSFRAANEPVLTMSRGFDHVAINLQLKRRFEANKGRSVMLTDVTASLSGSIRSDGSAVIGYGRIDGFCTSASNADETHCVAAGVSKLGHRKQIRRLMRLTNAFSKRLENHQAAMALRFG